MASITTRGKKNANTRASGSKNIAFMDGNRKRRTIILGDVPQKVAEEICRRVEYLAAAKDNGVAIDADTARWVNDVQEKNPVLAAKLAKIELIQLRQTNADAVTLGAFLDGYFATLDVKPNTLKNLVMARRNLVEFFKADKPLPDVTPGDADEWRRWLKRPAKEGGQGLGANTIRRRVGLARQFFRSAVRKKLIVENPFSEMKDTTVKANRERDHFISLGDSQKVLDACPDTQWKLLFALCRYAGLRCPSELAGLKWSEVDWEGNRFTVHSPKTEHHEGKDKRDVPIFRELRPYLEAARDEAVKGAEYIITIPIVDRFRKGEIRWCGGLWDVMKRIVCRTGLKPWGKLFQNLRITRQTELVAMGHREHVVNQWLGNSQAIAREHYLRVTDADFAKATASAEGTESAAKGAALEAEIAQQKAQQQPAALHRILAQTVQKALENDGYNPVGATICEAVQRFKDTQCMSRDHTAATGSV